jgi:hypothetical protein
MSASDARAKQIAMHEAAHILHAARMGAKKVVIYGAQCRHGRGFHALTEPVYQEPPIQIVDSARYLAAGGAAERMLASAPVGDDPADFEDFVTRAIVAGVAPNWSKRFGMLHDRTWKAILLSPKSNRTCTRSRPALRLK